MGEWLKTANPGELGLEWEAAVLTRYCTRIVLSDGEELEPPTEAQGRQILQGWPIDDRQRLLFDALLLDRASTFIEG